MKKLLGVLALLFSFSLPVFATQTWYIRTDGGTRYSANVTSGQCNGKFNVSYASTGGTGVNQNCAFKDYRYLYDDDSGIGAGAVFWVIAGGDTIIIQGCTASGSQVNPANPSCRLGWDGPTGATSGNWCYGLGNNVCYAPPVPSGTSGAHTKILGQNYAACNTGNNPATYEANLAQLFAGYGLAFAINLAGSQYVDISCLELTTHNKVSAGNAGAGGNCTGTDGNGGEGLPAYPVPCMHSAQPYDDYAQNGFLTSNTTANITFTDVYVHGMGASGGNGPIGAGMSFLRVNGSFNAMSWWNFDDGSDTANGSGASITATHVFFVGNGCYEEYPIVHSFPARACYDTASNGFGDTWSGQDAALSSFTVVDSNSYANTKDAFIGPHTQITNLSITNSYSGSNMGVQWKWAGALSSTITFQNNLTNGNCYRMRETIPGAAKSFSAFPGVTQVIVSSGTTAVVTMGTTTGINIGDIAALEGFNNSIAFLDGLKATVTAVTSTTVTMTLSANETNGTYTDTGWLGTNGAYLSLFCRSGGSAFQVITRSGSTNHYYGNTYIGASNNFHENNCGYYTTGNVFNQETNCGTSPLIHEDELYLGYVDPNVGATTWLFYQDQASVTWQGSYNDYYGVQGGNTSYTCGTNNITCTSPSLQSQPAQTWPGTETALDVFNPANGTSNAFYPTSTSPLIAAGTTLTGLTSDYYGTTRGSPPYIGGVNSYITIPIGAYHKGFFKGFRR